MKRTVSSWFVIMVVVGCFCAEARGEPGDYLLEFQKPNHAYGDRFARTMGTLGDNVLISAIFDDTVGFGAGAVYMYDGLGQLVQTFYNPTPYSGPGSEYFGRALGSVGNSVLVADNFDTSAVPAGGAVYMFDSTTGELQRTFLNPSGVGEENFAYSVAGVGTDKVLIGAWSAYLDDNQCGGAYLFSASTGEVLHSFSCPSPQENSRFGFSVLGIGDKIAISQPYFGIPDASGWVIPRGAVHLFDMSTGEHLHTILKPSPPDVGAHFGWSLASLGDKLVVGGGYGVCVFDPNTGELVLSIEDPRVYKSTVTGVGGDILVGDQYTGAGFSRDDDHIGRALVFDGETGELLLTIENPTPDTFEYFGISVAAVGNDIAVGTDYDDTRGFHSGAAYLFEGIPEPGTLSLLAVGGLALIRRRRRSPGSGVRDEETNQ